MKSTLVIISDDVLFSNFFIPILKRKEINIVFETCSKMSELNEKCDKIKCDLILVDGALKSVSSFEMIQNIRLKKLISVPIWYFPEISTVEYIHKSKQIGVNRIIEKPFDPYVVADEILIELNK